MNMTSNPSPPTTELAERIATELRLIAAWALRSAVQAEALPPGGDAPVYDEADTGEPRNTAAQIESQLALLLEEYLEPAERSMARVAGLLHAWRTETAGVDAEALPLGPEPSAGFDDSLALTTLSMRLPSEPLVAAFAEFARAAGDHYGLDVQTITKGRSLSLVLVPGSADKAAVRQCLSLLLEPWSPPAAGTGGAT